MSAPQDTVTTLLERLTAAMSDPSQASDQNRETWRNLQPIIAESVTRGQPRTQSDPAINAIAVGESAKRTKAVPKAHSEGSASPIPSQRSPVPSARGAAGWNFPSLSAAASGVKNANARFLAVSLPKAKLTLPRGPRVSPNTKAWLWTIGFLIFVGYQSFANLFSAILTWNTSVIVISALNTAFWLSLFCITLYCIFAVGAFLGPAQITVVYPDEDGRIRLTDEDPVPSELQDDRLSVIDQGRPQEAV